MAQKKRWFRYDDSPAFNTFIHIGMLVKFLAAIGIMVWIWYYL